MFNLSRIHTLEDLDGSMDTISADYNRRFLIHLEEAHLGLPQNELVNRASVIAPQFTIHVIPDATRTGLDIIVAIHTNDAANADPNTDLDAHIYRAANSYIATTIRPELCPPIHRWGQENPEETVKTQHRTNTDTHR